MRPARFWQRLACLALPLVFGLAAAGCHTYKYYDLHVTFDPTGMGTMPGFTKASAFTVQVCRVTVSGADSAQFNLPHGDVLGASNADQRCPNLSPTGDPLDAGLFEFSTFADSGSLKFTLDAFQMLSETDNCKIGTGSVSLPVSGMITTMGNLPIQYTGVTCADTGQHQGDANGPPGG
jgi:hypothetical protein